MTYHGTVQNGVVVLPEGVILPEGTQVTVAPIASTDTEPTRAEKKTIWRKMVELAERVESEPCDLPEDLADNHDHYLHGLPKR